MRLALYQPDIPQNTGAILRLAVCLGVPVDIIEPCGFVWSDSRLRRAGLDYLAHVKVTRHSSWRAYLQRRGTDGDAGPAGRLILLTTRAPLDYADFAYRASDTLIVGRESAGVPEAVHEAADARVKVPMVKGLRSLNIALAAAMVLGEALRQTARFPRRAH